MVPLRAFVIAILLAAGASACGDSETSVDVDAELPPRTIAVEGDAEVGGVLQARISPDLEGKIVSWGWHRCFEVPSCLTIPGADGSEYRPAEDDAWQVLRVIAVAERPDAPPGGVTTVVGPIENPDPKPFGEDMTLTSGIGGTMAVASGMTRVSLNSQCVVTVVMTIATPRRSGPPGRQILYARDISGMHELRMNSEGGQLLLISSGDCEVEAHIEGAR